MATYTVGTGAGFDYSAVNEVNAATFASGDFVLFNRGETFTTIQLTCDQSGVTYGATGEGADPIISGGGLLSPIQITAPCTVQDLSITEPGGGSARGIGLNLTGIALIRRCSIDGAGSARGIRILVSGDLVVEDCVITNTTEGIYIEGDTGIVRNTTINGGTNNGITAPTVTTLDLLNVETSDRGASGVAVGSGTVTATLCKANNCSVDGYQSNNTANFSLYGCTANSNGGEVSDSGDGFTAHDTAVLNLYGCQGSKNFKSGVKVVQASSGEIINCSFYDNYDDTYANDNYGISLDNDSGNWTVKNCITQGHRREIQVTSAAVAGTGVFTISNNIYNNTRETNAYEWGGVASDLATFNTSASDATSIQADPLFVDAESLVLSLSAGSPAIAAGTKWWTGAEPVGADGEPFSDMDTDIGGIQSKLSPFHPARL